MSSSADARIYLSRRWNARSGERGSWLVRCLRPPARVIVVELSLSLERAIVDTSHCSSRHAPASCASQHLHWWQKGRHERGKADSELAAQNHVRSRLVLGLTRSRPHTASLCLRRFFDVSTSMARHSRSPSPRYSSRQRDDHERRIRERSPEDDDQGRRKEQKRQDRSRSTSRDRARDRKEKKYGLQVVF